MKTNRCKAITAALLVAFSASQSAAGPFQPSISEHLGASFTWWQPSHGKDTGTMYRLPKWSSWFSGNLTLSLKQNGG